MVTKREPTPRAKRDKRLKGAKAPVTTDPRLVTDGGSSALDRYLQQALAESRARPRRNYRKPLGQMIAELTKDVPKEDLDRLPRDGSLNHDHYIYGTPKRYK